MIHAHAEAVKNTNSAVEKMHKEKESCTVRKQIVAAFFKRRWKIALQNIWTGRGALHFVFCAACGSGDGFLLDLAGGGTILFRDSWCT